MCLAPPSCSALLYVQSILALEPGQFIITGQALMIALVGEIRGSTQSSLLAYAGLGKYGIILVLATSGTFLV